MARSAGRRDEAAPGGSCLPMLSPRTFGPQSAVARALPGERALSRSIADRFPGIEVASVHAAIGPAIGPAVEAGEEVARLFRERFPKTPEIVHRSSTSDVFLRRPALAARRSWGFPGPSSRGSTDRARAAGSRGESYRRDGRRWANAPHRATSPRSRPRRISFGMPVSCPISAWRAPSAAGHRCSDSSRCRR
jgi:hypothetical protein